MVELRVSYCRCQGLGGVSCLSFMAHLAVDLYLHKVRKRLSLWDVAFRRALGVLDLLGTVV